MKYCLRIQLMLLMAMAMVAFGCGGKEGAGPPLPDWIQGEWTGSFGFEHDVIRYHINVKLVPEKSLYTLAIPGENQVFHLELESASGHHIRFMMHFAGRSERSPVPEGIIEFVRLEDPIHVQFYPEGVQELWLGGIEPEKR